MALNNSGKREKSLSCLRLRTKIREFVTLLSMQAHT